MSDRRSGNAPLTPTGRRLLEHLQRGAPLRREFRDRITVLAKKAGEECGETCRGCSGDISAARVYLGRRPDGYSAQYYLRNALDYCLDSGIREELQKLHDDLERALAKYVDDSDA